MTVAYDGAPFHGFARNPGVATVQGLLEDALGRVLGHDVGLSCAGRTDRGVHARRQVVSFDADRDRLDEARLVRSVNKLGAPAVVVTAIRRVGPDFDARLSCTGRVYRYRVLNSTFPDPLLAPLTWHVSEPLSVAAMRIASDRLLGEHDFSSFCRRNKSRPEESLVRQVTAAEWTEDGDILSFSIAANAFCHHMVRSVVGTIVDVGRGRRAAADMGPILEARDRETASGPAPPHGLVLWAACYDPRPRGQNRG